MSVYLHVFMFFIEFDYKIKSDCLILLPPLFPKLRVMVETSSDESEPQKKPKQKFRQRFVRNEAREVAEKSTRTKFVLAI